eukprot:TRINITY_DN3200_c0_g1_i8.p2 TRINITY_DN3200_c0_g1~~TRINITY_DN3200_c0_g1_i8.p2  ORF type:complete len:176 (-),score=13.63 TRINITY_DN3200_c0_g1_i8:76-603(-)
MGEAKAHIIKVRDWYVESFEDLREFTKVSDINDELQFTTLLRKIYRRHKNVVPTMARGVGELKDELNVKEVPEIHTFLDGFYMSRIGIRMLIGQHISLHSEPQQHHIGFINTRCSPAEVANQAIEDAQQICMRQYGDAPQVKVYGSPDFAFPYIPAHLHHMVFELVKNSLRAVQE